MKTITTTIFLAAILFGCNEKKVAQGATKTYELSPDGDTVNVIDNAGRKQGIWIKSKLHPNEPKDTVIYKDGIEVK